MADEIRSEYAHRVIPGDTLANGNKVTNVDYGHRWVWIYTLRGFSQHGRYDLISLKKEAHGQTQAPA